MEHHVKRGDIYYADLSPVVGSEQGGMRPVLIIQNNVGNRYSPTVIAAAITSQGQQSENADTYFSRCPHVWPDARFCDFNRTDSHAGQTQTAGKMGTLDASHMDEVDRALAVSFGLNAKD